MSTITKIKTILISVAGGLVLLSAVLFFITPLISPVVGDYDSFQNAFSNVFVKGIIALFTFDFSNRLFLVFMGFAIVALVIIIWWVIVLILKKRFKDILWVIPVVALDFVFMMIMACYVLARVTVAGEEGILYARILAVEDNLVSSLLSSISILLSLFAVLLAAIMVFYDVTVSTFELKPEVKVVRVVQTKVIRRNDATDDDYYERMIREMGMFHTGENE